MYFSASYGGLFSSINSGVSVDLLQNVSMFRNWKFVATNDNGQQLVAVQEGLGIFVSYDQGIVYVQFFQYCSYVFYIVRNLTRRKF